MSEFLLKWKAVLGIVLLVFAAGGAWAINQYQTSQNTVAIGEIKDNYVTKDNLKYQLEPVVKSLDRLEDHFGTKKN